MQQFELKRVLFDKDIVAQVACLDEGITVLLTGGDKSHVGAVSIAEPEGEAVTCQTITFPGHKERLLSEIWARAIADKRKCRTIVQAGIHYDNATKEQIRDILQVTDELLTEMLNK